MKAFQEVWLVYCSMLHDGWWCCAVLRVNLKNAGINSYVTRLVFKNSARPAPKLCPKMNALH